MDIHPAPFPGKRRPATANAAKKDRDRAKTSTQLAEPTRPKRAFGTSRSTNISVEKPLLKPLPAKPSKPWKPSGNGTQKLSNENGFGKAKGNPQVFFQEPAKKVAEAESTGGIDQSFEDERACTPTSSLIKAAEVVGTPYQTAENCSKCRLDKLETSAYWLAQIKVAESVGRHFVSAAFFRLALECHAQPFHSLQSELKHYVARHKSISYEILWSDLCKVYGFSTDQSSTDPCDLDKHDAVLVEREDSKPNTQEEGSSEELKDECFAFGIIDNTLRDIAEKETRELTHTNLTVTSDDDAAKDFVNLKAIVCSSRDSPSKNKAGLKSLESNVSGRKSYHEKSKPLSSSHLSLGSRTQRSGGSCGKGQAFLCQNQPGSKISGGKPGRRSAAGSKHSQSSQLLNHGKEDDKSTSPRLSHNVKDIVEDATADQDQQEEGLYSKEQVEGLRGQLLPSCQ